MLLCIHAPDKSQGLDRKNTVVRKCRGKETTVYNVRFCEMAAVTPQTILYRFERLSPAASVVEAATSQSRWDVSCKLSAACGKWKSKCQKFLRSDFFLQVFLQMRFAENYVFKANRFKKTWQSYTKKMRKSSFISF
jgi:hypothetical protein